MVWNRGIAAVALVPVSRYDDNKRGWRNSNRPTGTNPVKTTVRETDIVANDSSDDMLIVSPLYGLVTSCVNESTVKKAIPTDTFDQRVTRAICVGTAAVGIPAV